jgi:hypothetical protein
MMIVKFIRHGAGDNSPYSQEPDEVKVSCPVRNWRRGGKPPRRPELIRWAATGCQRLQELFRKGKT